MAPATARASAHGPEHEAALDWAASLVRRLDDLDLGTLRVDWNSAEHTHRAQLKKTAPDMLRQLWVYVDERRRALSAA